jgi:hypothetical protein
MHKLYEVIKGNDFDEKNMVYVIYNDGGSNATYFYGT